MASFDLGNAVGGLMIALALIPIIGLGVMFILREWITKSIGAVEAIPAIGVLLAFQVAAIRFQDQAGVIMVVLLSLMAFFPFAQQQMNRHMLREITAGQVDRAHQALSQRSDNLPAWFALSEGLWAAGHQGHAIQVCEQTLNRISTAVDPMSNVSMRHHFMREEMRLKMWKEVADLRNCQPIKCPFCGEMNAPGLVACGKCGRAYLLETVRRNVSRRSILSRLVLGWALLALFIGGAALVGAALGTVPAIVGAVLVAVVALGLVMNWLFRAPPG
ncbi:MAG: hypothetical protein MH204_04180, partial [Fimbriimonadaceae bacterium]|nr:hypothetical protein [Fimbriimonadaceae bacterium]